VSWELRESERERESCVCGWVDVDIGDGKKMQGPRMARIGRKLENTKQSMRLVRRERESKWKEEQKRVELRQTQKVSWVDVKERERDGEDRKWKWQSILNCARPRNWKTREAERKWKCGQ
jgi:hypothetical protein